MLSSVTLVQLAHAHSRAQFAARLPHCFLILDEGLCAPPDLAFATLVRPSPARASSPSAQLQLLEIAKTPGNPYPDRVSVGRARNCDLVIRDASVSKLHAYFGIAGTELELIDLDSHNGTQVNGRRLISRQRMLVGSGDVIAFGSVSARLLDAVSLYDLLR